MHTATTSPAPAVELVDVIPWDSALARTTSSPLTKHRVAFAINQVRFLDDELMAGRVTVEPHAGGSTVTLAWKFSVNPGPSAFAKIILTAGFPVEIYDTGRRSGTRLSLDEFERRASFGADTP